MSQNSKRKNSDVNKESTSSNKKIKFNYDLPFTTTEFLQNKIRINDKFA